MKLSIFSFLSLSLAASGAMAQSADASAQKPRWGFGLGAVVSDSVYAGEGTRVKPVPLLSYEGERFYWRGISGGAHLMRIGDLAVDATLSGRMDGVDRKDFGTAELAERGVNRALLSDRDNGLDLGLAVNTVARAYRELESEGRVETRGRAGTVVASPASDAARSELAAHASAYLAHARRLGVGLEESVTVLRDAAHA